MRRRLLEQKRRALSKTRDTAERRLEIAELKNAGRGPFRRLLRDDLRAEIDLQRHALKLADERLAETTALLEKSRLEIRELDRTSERCGRGTGSPGRKARDLGLTRER